MGDDKNHLYTRDDVLKDSKETAKRRTQQGFSRFSIAATEGLTSAAQTAVSPATQEITKPQIGEPIKDTYGTVKGIVTIPLNQFGSDYNFMSIDGDVTFVFTGIPFGRNKEFTLDFTIATSTPPTITFPPEVLNPPILPPLVEGSRHVTHFHGMTNELGTHYHFIGGTPGASTIAFPVKYPKIILNPTAGGTATIDMTATTGNAVTIQFPAGDITLVITPDPVNTIGQDLRILFIQDATGGRSLTAVPTKIVNGTSMDGQLNKDPLGKTMFRLTTLDGGASYFAEEVNLTTGGTAGALSGLAIDTNKDWNNKSISNLAGLDLFANMKANKITNVDRITFISNAAAARGSIGRSDGITGIPDGTSIDMPSDSVFSLTHNSKVVLKYDPADASGGGRLTVLSSASTPVERLRIDSLGIEVFASLDILPNANVVQSLGVAGKSWRNVRAGKIIFTSNQGITATNNEIALTSASMRINTIANNEISLEVAAVKALTVGKLNVTVTENHVLLFEGTAGQTDRNASITKFGVEPLTIKTSNGVTLSAGFSTAAVMILTLQAPLASGVPAQITFKGDNSSGTETEYTVIKSRIENNVAGAIKGSLEFEVYEDNSPVQYIKLHGDQKQILMSKDTFFSDVVRMNTNPIIFTKSASDKTTLLNAAQLYSKADTDTRTKLFYAEGKTASVAGRIIGPLIGSPLTAKGDLFTRSATDDAKFPAGANGDVLTAELGETLGLKYDARGGKSWKLPVRVIATAVFVFPSIGQLQDGVTLAVGDRVLLIAETTAKNNGIWKVNGAFVNGVAPLIRPDDFNSNADMVSESIVMVEEGTLHGKQMWQLTTINPIVDGTTSQTWEQFGNNGGEVSGFRTYRDSTSSNEGFWHQVVVTSADQLIDLQLPDNEIAYIAYVPTKNITIAQLGLVVTDFVTTNNRLDVGLYSSNTLQQPAALIQSRSKIIDAEEFVEFNISDTLLTAGTLFFFAVKIKRSSAPNPVGIGKFRGFLMTPLARATSTLGSNLNQASQYGWDEVFTTNGLPATASNLTPRGSNVDAPAVLFSLKNI